MKKEVIIIGGGLAGISAALQSIEKGYRPILLEKNGYLGGRVRSLYAADIKEYIDNGQHVLSAAYEETIRLLHMLASFEKVNFQKNLSIQFIENPESSFFFRTGRFPAPFHFFIPLMSRRKMTGADITDYISFFKKNLNTSPAELEEKTALDWLIESNQQEQIRKFLWEPFSLAILNTPLEKASALLLYNAVTKAFLQSKEKAGLGIPKTWLSEIFADPAEKFIGDRGGSIHLMETVTKFLINQKQVVSIVTKKQTFDAPRIICTVPPFALQRILDDSSAKYFEPLKESIRHLAYSPIITINLYLKNPIDLYFPIALVNSPLQWIFAQPQRKTKKHYGYALVMSAADNWTGRTSDDIIEMVSAELKRVLGIDLRGEHELKKYKIVKEKRATILQTPEVLKYRPGVATPFENLFLAGDWIDTGLPATIEGAVVSGKMAVEAMSEASD